MKVRQRGLLRGESVRGFRVFTTTVSRIKLPDMSMELAQLGFDRYEIADTFHRYSFGLHHGDPDSLESAFTEDCVFDFWPAGRKLGIDFPNLTGRQAILEACFHFLVRSTPATLPAISKSKSAAMPPRPMGMSCRNISCHAKVRVADRRTRS